MSNALFPDVAVNGTTIPSAAIAAEAQNHEAPQGKPGLAWRKAARALIIRELLLQKARDLGLQEQPALVGQGRRETEEEAQIRAVLDCEVEIDVPSSDAVRHLWAQDPDRFRSPPLWEVSHILCAADPENEDARVQAKARADAITTTVLKNPKDFGRIAKEQSDCSSNKEGGVLGQLSPGDTVPEFEAVLRQLAEGEITTDPVMSRFGFHIVRLDACAQGRVLPFEAVQPRLKEAMEKAAWTKAVQGFTRSLVARAEIVGIDDLEAF